MVSFIKPGTSSWCAWFLEIDFVCDVCMCVCVCPPLRPLITSGVIWTPYDWVKKFYSFYMAAAVVIGNGRGLRIEVGCGN